MHKIELAELYWKTLATGKWTDFVEDQIVPFMECYQFFRAGQAPPDFPQLGILASTADFSYCHPKVVESPTLQEIVIVSTISHLSSFCLYLILMLCHMHKHLLLFTCTCIQPRVRI